MTANRAAVQSLADLALACGRAREAAQAADLGPDTKGWGQARDAADAMFA